VNLSGEQTKGGVPPEEVEALLALADVRGLSTMPPAAAAPEASRPYFRRLRELAAAHGLAELSIGTSQDYRVAAEEGATFIRVGSGLFRG
jgi:PLP dependent protein